ncbi:uncharacterized protein [Lolium perenne]|uniref:uncharacterized protein n=1 Tax=Lolium perenne TaxID=4522 RepID=UPI003A99744D
MGDKILRDLWIPQDLCPEGDQPGIPANNFELKPALISMIQHNQFGGTGLESPHTHIRNFLEYCNTLKYNGVPHDYIKMQLFPFSLRDGAKHWFHAMPPHHKDTWAHLLQAFYRRYFPPTKAAEYRDKINRFIQFDGESLYDAWQRYQGLIKMCPNHGQEPWLLLQTFYKGLTSQTRAHVDSAAGGGIMNKTLDEATELIERMASHDFSWTNDRALHNPLPGIHKISQPDSVAAQLEAITKQLSSIRSDSSSVVSAVQSIGNCQACGNAGHQTHECMSFASGDPIVSKVAYTQGYHNQNSQYNQNSEMKEFMQQQQAMMNGLQETIQKQSDAFLSTLQRLIANLQPAPNHDPRLPSKTEPNPKSHCGAISAVEAVTTRSGINTASARPSAKEKLTPPPEASVPMTVPFPARLEKSKDEKQYAKFIDKMKEVQVTIPILDAVLHVPMYAKFSKELLTKKRNLEDVEVAGLLTVGGECVVTALVNRIRDMRFINDNTGCFSNGGKFPKNGRVIDGRAAGSVEVLVVGASDAGKGATAEGAGRTKSARTAKPPTERDQEATGASAPPPETPLQASMSVLATPIA